jgi:ribonuclease E
MPEAMTGPPIEKPVSVPVLSTAPTGDVAAAEADKRGGMPRSEQALAGGEGDTPRDIGLVPTDGADSTPVGGAAEDGRPGPTAPRTGQNRRRRGSRGGRGRSKASVPGSVSGNEEPEAADIGDGADRTGGTGGTDVLDLSEETAATRTPTAPSAVPSMPPTLAARPKIGDSRPARPESVEAAAKPSAPAQKSRNGSGNGSRSGGGGRSSSGTGGGSGGGGRSSGGGGGGRSSGGGGGRSSGGGGGRSSGGRGSGGGETLRAENEASVESIIPVGSTGEASTSNRRGGRERGGKAVGRYMMCVHVQPDTTQIALLEGRTLVEHYVSRAADDATQIDGNIYRGRVQNVLPGMEAAFIDIGTPKNAVLYRGDVRYDKEDIESGASATQPRIEEVLRPGQIILCQVTKNPIGAKGARLTQEVSIPGRFVVLVPDSTAFGISKRLDDSERKRLRKIVDAVRPKGHGLIVRTAAAGASADELRNDVARLVTQWEGISAAAAKGQGAALLYREPVTAVRVIREELNREYRAVVIDDLALFEQVRDYVGAVNPELADRVEYFDSAEEPLPVFERFHVHEQLHKALGRKVYLPSGGSLVIDRTEALTVIDVNTGKNVGTTNLEETVYRNNLEAAEEVARQLRLRDIGGIIVIDFIDMEIRENRDKVASALRAALARDKTRTQVFDISELGLVEMTRKRISEGLIESLSTTCEVCEGRGIVFSASDL